MFHITLITNPHSHVIFILNKRSEKPAPSPHPLPHRAQAQRGGQAHELPPAAAGRAARPALARLHALHAQPLPGGDRRLQALPAREPPVPGAQHLRRPLLLQARLLRHLAGGARRLPSAPPGLGRRHQPEGKSPWL